MYKANLTWESLLVHFPTVGVNIEFPSELKNKNTTINIQRGKDFKILFNIETQNIEIDEGFFEGERVIGKPYQNESKIRIVNEEMETEVDLYHLHFTKGSETVLDPHGKKPAISKLQGYFDKIEVKISKRQEVHSMDWIINMKFDDFPKKNCRMRYFSDSLEFELGDCERKSIGQPDFVSMRDSFCLTINNIKIIVGMLKNNIFSLDKNFKPGFIYYSEVVSDDFKEKFREALSFLLGRKIETIGKSKFTSDGFLVGYDCLSPYIISDTIFSQPSYEPACYENEYENRTLGFNYIFIEKFISNFINKYDENDLKHVFWMYWHAMYSPLHVRAGSFGAIVEFILGRIEVDTTLINKTIFKPFRKEMIVQFEKFCEANSIADQEIIKTIKDNISGNINKLSIRKQMDKAYEVIGVSMSDFERQVWQRRNDSAHGNKNDSDFDILIREVYAFQSVCNRTILKVLDLSDNYIDYYNYDYPVLKINESLADMEKPE